MSRYVVSLKASIAPCEPWEFPSRVLDLRGLPMPDNAIMRNWHWEMKSKPIVYHTRMGELFAGLPWDQPKDNVPFGMKDKCRILIQDPGSLKLYCCGRSIKDPYCTTCQKHASTAGCVPEDFTLDSLRDQFRAQPAKGFFNVERVPYRVGLILYEQKVKRRIRTHLNKLHAQPLRAMCWRLNIKLDAPGAPKNKDTYKTAILSRVGHPYFEEILSMAVEEHFYNPPRSSGLGPERINPLRNTWIRQLENAFAFEEFQ